MSRIVQRITPSRKKICIAKSHLTIRYIDIARRAIPRGAAAFGRGYNALFF